MSVPRAVRRRGACDRALGARRGCADRRSSSFGRESRVPWRDDASWADTSASSEVSEILSIRPRGSGRCRPRGGTRTRRRTGAQSAFVRPGDDRSARSRVSNDPDPALTGGNGRAVERYSLGVSRNRLAGPEVPVLSFPSPRCQNAPRTHPKTSETGIAASGMDRRQAPDLAFVSSTSPPIVIRSAEGSKSTEWTRNRSGAPHLESCRSASPRRTMRPGCAIRASSMSMTTCSGSRPRTASPRTGSRRAIGR